MADQIVANVAADQEMAKINREFQEKSTLRHAHELGIPYIDIAKTPLNPDFLKIVDLEVAKKGRVIPFFRVGKKIRVAVDNLENPETQNLIKLLEGQGNEIDISLASSSGMDDAFKIYDASEQYKKIEIVESVESKSIATYEKEIATLKDLPTKLEEVTAEEGLNLLNVGAMKTNASDIHYEPEEDGVIVRFRIDGILHKVFKLKADVYKKIAEQLKYQGKMRLNVNTSPQDGRYVFNFNDKKIAVRTASIPTPFGESFVCRYLPSDKKTVTFEELVFQGISLKKLENVTKIAQGMVLVTGPKGSGKSTTLYSILSRMSTPENKVITLEDPVEFFMEGVTQSQIDEKRGYTFANGLRSILRHDPNIVMIGEIRDLETAETAAQAALTGHVLLSTLHTNSAIEAIPRMINMGLPPFMVAPSVNTIIGQRLVRKVCEKCGVLEPINESERKEFEMVMKNLQNINPAEVIPIPEQVKRIKGCDDCSNTGYSGRIVIVEVITIGAEIKKLILDNASTVDIIAATRKEGMLTMREDGLIKVAQGKTTLEEVHRVTNFLG